MKGTPMYREATAVRNLQQVITDFDTAETEMACLCNMLEQPASKKVRTTAARHESQAVLLLEAAQMRIDDLRRVFLRHPHVLDTSDDTRVVELYRTMASKCHQLHAWAERLLYNGYKEFDDIVSAASEASRLILPLGEPAPTTQPMMTVRV